MARKKKRREGPPVVKRIKMLRDSTLNIKGVEFSLKKDCLYVFANEIADGLIEVGDAKE